MPNQYMGKLLIIVPVTKMANKLENLQTWLSKTTNQEVKILIVHDIADEPTSLELKEIVSKFSSLKIELIEKKLNSPGLARNLGLARANFEWISFVDSDDLVDVSELLNMISKSPLDAEIVIGNYKVSSSKGTKSMKTSEFIDPKMNVAMNPGIWRMIFRQEVIGMTRFSKYKMGEDQLFLLDIDFFRRSLFFSNLVPYTYFQNVEGQLTSDRQSVKDISNVVKETIQKFKGQQ
jgi:glycosyltransferase involved in cell wall biosynthesis